MICFTNQKEATKNSENSLCMHMRLIPTRRQNCLSSCIFLKAYDNQFRGG